MRLAIVLLAGLAGAAPALAEDRALVIGNADYRNVPDLAGSDTAALARGLREAGFVTLDGIDIAAAPLWRMAESLARADDAPGARIVVLNGRFLNDGRETWFMGSDVESPASGGQGLPLSLVMRLMATGPQGGVLILGTDGQQMPLRPGLHNGIGPLPAESPGLRIITGTPEAGARAVAALAHGASLGQAVAADAELRLVGDAPPAPGPWRPGPQGAVPAQDPDRELWAAAALSDGPQAYEAYLARFPEGVHAGAARQRLAQLAWPAARQQADRDAWIAAAATDTPAGYRDYLARFADGRFAALAQVLVKQSAPADPASQRQAAALAEQSLALEASDRAAIQRHLARLGLDPGLIDGVFGASTREAIATWQRDNGLAVTGYLTRRQARQIERQSLAPAAEPPSPEAATGQRLASAAPGKGGTRSLAPAPDPAVTPGRGTAGTRGDDLATWRWALRQDSAAGYEIYLERFPFGARTAEAETRLRTLRAATEAARREEEALELQPAQRKLVETRLHLIGMRPGKVDGEFTAETRAALRRYQAARNLRVTGYVTQQTFASLLAPAPARQAPTR